MASKTYQVILITRPNRIGLKEACDKNSIELIEVAVPNLIRCGTQRFGNLGMWLRVRAWAAEVRRVVKSLDASRDVAYGHLVTFHSVQMPSVFDECKFTKVWGPVSGMEYVPSLYLYYLGPDRLKESLRNLLLKLTKKFVQQKSRGYDVMLYGNSQTMNATEKRRNGVARIVMPNNIDTNSGDFMEHSWKISEDLRLLFVGTCQAQRALPLVLEAMAGLKSLKWSIDIAGTGSGLDFWKSLAEKLEISDRVKFHGWVGKDVVDRLYNECHLFVFPSLRDGGGSGMLEAIDRGMPVLALDWGGPSDVIGSSGAGYLFPVSNPKQTVQAIREWFEELFAGKIQYSTLVSATRNFDVHQFSWEFKSNALESALEEVNCSKKRASQQSSSNKHVQR